MSRDEAMKTIQYAHSFFPHFAMESQQMAENWIRKLSTVSYADARANIDDFIREDGRYLTLNVFLRPREKKDDSAIPTLIDHGGYAELVWTSGKRKNLRRQIGDWVDDDGYAWATPETR